MPPRRPAVKPLKRWGETWRIGLASVVGLLLWFAQFTVAEPPGDLLPLLDLVLGIAAIIALHWRRRWPLAVAGLTIGATTVSGMAVGAAVIAFISLVTTRQWRPIAVGVAIGIAAMLVSDQLVTEPVDQSPWWGLLVAGVVTWGTALVIGLYVAARRELAETARAKVETAEREQAARVESARTNERTQIAREMHDVLAHRISLVAMHAGAMTYRPDLSREDLLESAQIVQANAHLALTDLRDVLGVLRETPVAILAPTPPQPTLEHLPDLLREAREAGTPVELRSRLSDDLTPPDLTPPDLVARTAYRIVQEGLTNARKHAAGSPVVVSLTGAPQTGLGIEVRNPAATGGARSLAVPGAGMGLVGLAERAALAGGRLSYGTEQEEFVLRAWLPWT